MAIVAAVDGGERPHRVVTVGRELADSFDDELVVLHVMSEGAFERRREGREYYVDQATGDAARTARWVVNGTLDDVEGVTLAGRVGEPADTISQVAAERDRGTSSWAAASGRRWGRSSSVASPRPSS